MNSPSMVITIVEAQVEETQWETLKSAYTQEATDLPEAIKQTFLLQSKSQPTTWRIVTHWRSQADLDQMRQTTAVPVAIKVFTQVGGQTTLGIWDIASHQAHS